MPSSRSLSGQPVGAPVTGWTERPRPMHAPMQGRFCSLLPADPDGHAEALHLAYSADTDGRGWTYLPYGPFSGPVAFRKWMHATCTGPDPMFFTVCDRTGQPAGLASYLRITPEHGTIEAGHIHFAPCLQRTPEATEAMWLMLRHAFDDLGYRRYEWKCDSLNAASRRAAQRLGFTFEGIFRQAAVVKGRNRDTAWYAITDAEWPALSVGYKSWLEECAGGSQKRPLSWAIAEAVARRRR